MEILDDPVGQTFYVVMSEPWDFITYLHNPAFEIKVMRVIGKSWVAKLDRLIFRNGVAVTHVLISPRGSLGELSTISVLSPLVVVVVPMLDHILEDLDNMSEDAVKKEAHAQAGWWLIASLNYQRPILRKTDGFNYYATHADHANYLPKVEALMDVRYVRRSALEVVYERLLDIPNLGVSVSGCWSGECNYWITDAFRLGDLMSTVALQPTFADIRRRGVAILDNTVTLTISGLYQGASMITGYFEYHTDNPQVQNVYSQYLRQVRENFTEVQGCWLGPEAYMLFQSGMRFTTSVAGPESYDLIKPAA